MSVFRSLADVSYLTKGSHEGAVLVHPEIWQMPDIPDYDQGQILMKRNLNPDRVQVVLSGGGAGGPEFDACVGDGLADVSVVGGFHASPNAYSIYQAVKYIGSRKGAVLLFNNFMGDCLNNDMAKELLELEGYPASCIIINDDCLSMPIEKRSERVGIQGIMLMVKIASSCAEAGMSLEQITDVLNAANQRLSSVALSIDYDSEKLMMGAGFSGEPPRKILDEFTMEKAVSECYDTLYDDLKPKENEKIFLMVGRQGRIIYEEAYIFAKELSDYSAGKKKIDHLDVGYYTRLTMTDGFHITMLCADAALEKHLKKECITDSFWL